jgi:hypothetical protein
MANYSPKGRERMRVLGRLGGVKSGETRRLNALRLRLVDLAFVREACEQRGCTAAEIDEALKPINARGGSHDTDWRCPECGHFSNVRSRVCAGCKAVGPANGRLTRRALQARVEEYRTDATLRKHGL